MADDLQNYKLQLQQVEAALLTDPDNGELLKLKEDLVEVIELTRDLIKTQLEEQKKTSYVESNKSYASVSDVAEASSTSHGTTDEFDEIEAALLAAEKGTSRPNWKIGDKCQAKWTEDGNYYDAIIEGISESGEVNVVFEAYQNRSTTTVNELKVRVVRNEVFPSTKRLRHNNKEYLKKKKAKKQQRFKDLEEEREQDKNKWLNFSTKNTKKSGQAKVKSIFASPDNVNGRVGIGTCGVSGKEMTKYSYGEKYRKGT